MYRNSRLKFPKGKQRQYLEKVIIKSELNASELAKLVNVSPRTIRDWKREKYHLPLQAHNIFCHKFSIKSHLLVNKYLNDWKKDHFEKCHKGGVAYYKKFGLPGDVESRRRGGFAGLAKIRQLGLAAPIRYFKEPCRSNSLAEFVGIMLGDGSIGKLQISITLNSIADLKYSSYVSCLGNKLFGCHPKIRRRKNCIALDLCYTGTNLVKFLINHGMHIGNKVKQQVGVPEWIRSNRNYTISCLRGLMDTDGGVIIHRYKVNGKGYAYKKICFTNRSVPLLRFVYGSLNGLGFTPKLVDKVENKKVWLYNTHEVEKYLQLIGSSNERLGKYLL